MATFAAGTIIDLHAREAITLHDVRGTTLRVDDVVDLIANWSQTQA